MLVMQIIVNVETTLILLIYDDFMNLVSFIVFVYSQLTFLSKNVVEFH